MLFFATIAAPRTKYAIPLIMANGLSGFIILALHDDVDKAVDYYYYYYYCLASPRCEPHVARCPHRQFCVAGYCLPFLRFGSGRWQICQAQRGWPSYLPSLSQDANRRRWKVSRVGESVRFWRDREVARYWAGLSIISTLAAQHIYIYIFMYSLCIRYIYVYMRVGYRHTVIQNRVTVAFSSVASSDDVAESFSFRWCFTGVWHTTQRATFIDLCY